MRFDHEFQSAQLGAARGQFRITDVAQDDHRYFLGLRICPESRKDLKPIHLWQAHVENNEIRVLIGRHAQSLFTVTGDNDLAPRGNERQPLHVCHGLIVFDQEDLEHRHGGFSGRPCVAHSMVACSRGSELIARRSSGPAPHRRRHAQHRSPPAAAPE
jgi:hypothetical protein